MLDRSKQNPEHPETTDECLRRVLGGLGTREKSAAQAERAGKAPALPDGENPFDKKRFEQREDLIRKSIYETLNQLCQTADASDPAVLTSIIQKTFNGAFDGSQPGMAQVKDAGFTPPDPQSESDVELVRMMVIEGVRIKFGNQDYLNTAEAAIDATEIGATVAQAPVTGIELRKRLEEQQGGFARQYYRGTLSTGQGFQASVHDQGSDGLLITISAADATESPVFIDILLDGSGGVSPHSRVRCDDPKLCGGIKGTNYDSSIDFSKLSEAQREEVMKEVSLALRRCNMSRVGREDYRNLENMHYAGMDEFREYSVAVSDEDNSITLTEDIIGGGRCVFSIALDGTYLGGTVEYGNGTVRPISESEAKEDLRLLYMWLGL